MSVSLTLVVVMGVLYSVGVYLMLERSMTKVLLGFLLVGNATNLLIITLSGPAGSAPFFGAEGMLADPLPQAFVLTSIVITFGVSAFLMALIYRSWRLARVDVVEDDVDDIELATRESTAESTDATSDDTEFGTRAAAAVSTAIDLEEAERLEEQRAVEEALAALEKDESHAKAPRKRDGTRDGTSDGTRDDKGGDA